MEIQSKRILSSILFTGASLAIGCSADPSDPADPEQRALEDEDLEDVDDLVDEDDEARSGGGGGCHHDHEPPNITTKLIELWPPNHKYEEIDLEDCFKKVEECDPHWTAKILWVTSDEPENGQGDGNTVDDIVCVDKDTVKLRAERQGGGDGRVYTIGFRAEDSKHNKTYGKCKVVVPHDQGGGDWAVDSGEDYRVSC